MDNLVIIGTGAMARDVTAFVKRYSLANILGYSCNSSFLEISKQQMPNEQICSIEELNRFYQKENVKLFVAISQFRFLNRDRRDTFDYLRKQGWHFLNLISPSAKMYSTHIGEGNWLMDDCFIGNEVEIGDNNVFAEQSYIAHYSKIRNNNYLGVRSMIMGTTTIAGSSFFGANSLVFNDCKIGMSCLIGGGQ